MKPCAGVVCDLYEASKREINYLFHGEYEYREPCVTFEVDGVTKAAVYKDEFEYQMKFNKHREEHPDEPIRHAYYDNFHMLGDDAEIAEGYSEMD